MTILLQEPELEDEEVLDEMMLAEGLRQSLEAITTDVEAQPEASATASQEAEQAASSQQMIDSPAAPTFIPDTTTKAEGETWQAAFASQAPHSSTLSAAMSETSLKAVASVIEAQSDK